MTRGLTTHHDALVVRPRVLRALDRVDAIVLDPRALYTDQLTITRVRGVTNSQRTNAWEAARVALDRRPEAGMAQAVVDSRRRPHRRGTREPGARPVRHGGGQRGAPGRGAGGLGRRRRIAFARTGFRHPVPDDGSLDDAVAEVVAQLGADGATVALVTTSEMPAAHGAGITIGISRTGFPPWGADVFAPDLTGAWRILHAMPAARAASTRGVRLSVSASAIGALMFIPGVPGYGPESVNAGVLGGLWAGYTGGSKVFGETLPAPEPGHEWYALPVAEVQRLLPRPPAPPRQTRRTCTAAACRAWPGGAASPGAGREFLGEMRTNLADPITPILATGAVASALLGSPLDAALVGGVLLANAALSSEQQLHAERVLRRLLAVQDPLARRRVGPLDAQRRENVAAKRLRPGDLIEIHAGEVVPADARLIEAANVEVDESTLTGESLPVPKHTDPTPGAPLAERSCMVYAGTTMVAGTALAVVTTVGRSTEIHRAMAMAPAKSRQIGLQRQLARITSRALPWSLAGGAAGGHPVHAAGHAAARGGRQRGRPDGRGGTRGPAAGRHAGSAGGGAAALQRARVDPQRQLGGGAGPARRGVLRQDRHAVREPAAGQAVQPIRARRRTRS